MRIPIAETPDAADNAGGIERGIYRLTRFLTGLGKELPGPRPVDAVLATADMTAAAFGICTVLAIALSQGWGDSRLLWPLLTAVLAGTSGAVVARLLRRPALAAATLLSAVLGWPVLLWILAADPVGARLQARGPVILVAMLVGLSLSTALRPRIAIVGLAIMVPSLMFLAAIAGRLDAEAWIAAIGLTVSGIVGVGRRATLDRLLRRRDGLSRLMNSLGPRESLSDTALEAVTLLREAGPFEAVFLCAFTPDGGARHLVHSSVLPGPIPLEFDMTLPESRAVYLRGRVADGPWISEWRPNGDPMSYADRMVEAGLRTMLFVPIVHEGAVVAALGVGYGAATAAAERRRWMLLYERMPSVVEAASLLGSVMAPQLAGLDHRESEIAAMTALIQGTRFHPVFQPVVELATGSVVGYEALTRFDGGEPPDSVFDRAARLGLGMALETATLGAALCAAADLDLRHAWLSVNMSPELVLSDAAATILRHAPRPLVVELTEHVAIEDYPSLAAALRGLGPSIRLAVDDAGSGFASLRHILELAPDVVKLDIGLIRGLDEDAARQALVAGMVHFADLSHFFLIAEGVETEPERDALIALGVRLGQGYLLGRPAAVARRADADDAAERAA
jgi:EAL domain-containing protein (putative c-di-GMP-specific phosphodiesterase class I)